jgi:hypothetical protein
MPEYRASPVPMPGNPAANRVGDKTGPFRILIESREPGGPWQRLSNIEEKTCRTMKRSPRQEESIKTLIRTENFPLK